MNKWLIIGVLLLVVGCKKPPVDVPVSGDFDNGLLILCEGLFNNNNASLAYYSFETNTAHTQVFSQANGRGLGDTANDMIYWQKNNDEFVLVCVDVSSQVEILDAKTMKSIAQIPLFNEEGNPREPRRVALNYDHTYAFVANFDSTVAVINLSNYQVDKLIKVGANSDGIAAFENTFYVTNSGGLNYPDYDTTISVINGLNGTVEESFSSRINSNQIIVNSEQDLFIRSNGNYADVLPAMVKIDGVTGEQEAIWEANYSSFQLLGDWLYFYDGDEQKIKRLNSITNTIDGSYSILIDFPETYGGFHLDEKRGFIYVIDLKGYVLSSTITILNMSGEYQTEFTAGLNANTIIPID